MDGFLVFASGIKLSIALFKDSILLEPGANAFFLMGIFLLSIGLGTATF